MPWLRSDNGFCSAPKAEKEMNFMYFFPVSSLILIMVQLNVGSVHPVCMVSIVTGAGGKDPHSKLSLPNYHPQCQLLHSGEGKISFIPLCPIMREEQRFCLITLKFGLRNELTFFFLRTIRSYTQFIADVHMVRAKTLSFIVLFNKCITGKQT